MREAIRLVGTIIRLILGGSSEGMTLPLQSTLDNLIEKHRDKLSQSKVYIAVTVYNQKPFISQSKENFRS